MGIDNLAEAKEIFDFDDQTEYFYRIEIVQRKNTDYFYIYKAKDLDRYKFIIKERCRNNDAKAYLRVTRRNIKKVSAAALQITTDHILRERFRPIKNAYIKAFTQTPDNKRKWIMKGNNHLTEYLAENNIPFVEIKSDYGTDIVTDQFNLYTHNEFMKEIPIQKDGRILIFAE